MLDRTDDVDCDDDDRHYYDTSSKEPSLGVPSPSATTDSPTESDPLWWESSIDNLVKKFDQDFTDISKNEDKDEDKEENGIENENIAQYYNLRRHYRTLHIMRMLSFMLYLIRLLLILR